MDKDIESEMQQRDACVIFVPGRGYFKNKRRDFTEDFTEARIFGEAKQAAHSIKTHDLVGQAHVVPVKMTLDPRQLFTAILKG